MSSKFLNLFPFKGDFSFGKSQKSQGAKSGLQGHWVTWVIWCFDKNSAWDVIREWACFCDEAVNHQWPIAAAFWVIQVVSAEGCSSLTQNLMQLCCSAHSVILNTTATQYTCSLNSIYRPHWPAQWSCHCSRLCIPVHFPWLPGYIDVAQNFLVILTMAGLFQDRPYKQI